MSLLGGADVACTALSCAPAVLQVLDKDFTLPIGKAKVMRQGKDITVTAFSKMVGLALDAAAELEKEGIDVEVSTSGRAYQIEYISVAAAWCCDWASAAHVQPA